ncbi:MAG: cytochrome c3 family protein [Armatimonadota bacterium]
MRTQWRWRLPPRLLEWRQRIEQGLRARIVRVTAKRLVTGAVILVIVSYLGLEATSHPRFCVTCHYMRPYYEAWQTSSHSDVACLECHYPPGVKSALWRKIGASVQVVKYITRQYGVRPFTEVDDRSCLRGGCHERRLLRGKVDFGGVVFDHAPHLGSFRRVTQLRCTACHSQIVQGTHMTVTVASCFLCHFKDPEKTPDVADCAICHKQAKLSGGDRVSTFDHAGLQALGVDCDECHSNVTRGHGPVPRDRCYHCHGEEERVARYHEVEFMHLNHVTEHKVECTRCHQEIEHSIPPAEARAELDCLSCHPNQHQATQKLYAGIGADQVGAQPDPMAQADVSCVSCHRTHRELGEGGSVLTAGAAGCMNCHGEAYGRILAAWQSTADSQVALIRQALRRARQEVGHRTPSASERKRAGELLSSAGAAARLVSLGGGVHNIEFAKALLESARRQINQAMQTVGSDYRVAKLPVASVPVARGPCLDCHTKPPQQDVRVFGADFSHAQHLRSGDLNCQRCHGDQPLDSPDHGRLRMGPGGCLSCHLGKVKSPHPRGWGKTHGQAGREQRQSCKLCHRASSCLTCHKVEMPHAATWQQKHGPLGAASPGICAKCHKPSECTDCHRTPMPHAADWPTQGHQPVARSRPGICARCHEDKECLECHGLEMPHVSTWTTKHGKQTMADAQVCAKCHQTADCTLCHKDGHLLPSTHGEKWPETHAVEGVMNLARCQLCHGENACDDCHGKNPHPEGFMLQHTDRARQRPSTCLVCHPREYCRLCHADPPTSHTQAFRDDHAQQGQAEKAVCVLCHGDDPCMDCHQTQIPHPGNYMLDGHPKEGSHEQDSFCYKCHDKQQYCAICHPDD